jgi:alkylhydroperoxidase family enzyme
MQKVPADVVEAIRNDQPIADSRLEALRVFTTLVVENRGWVSKEDIEIFISAGFTQAQVLEVILGISFKTLSNYVNHIADTPLDESFAPQKWQSPLKQKAS